MIRAKKNVILQGAPGVGKTYAAKRLAYSMMGEKNQERVMLVQFHQSYTYEDFIEGFRPTSAGNGFEIKKGSFYNFCKKAEKDLDNKYYLIIDEINRGNLSKIFGELLMLIEKDKRSKEELENCTEKIEKLQTDMEVQGQAYVKVTDQAYVGTKIIIGDLSMVVQSNTSYCKFEKVRGNIKAVAL